MSTLERFLRYASIYTTSDDFSDTTPSTERQKDLGRLLMQELAELGLRDIRMDGAGNVIADPAGEGRAGSAGAGAYCPHGHRSGCPRRETSVPASSGMKAGK